MKKPSHINLFIGTIIGVVIGLIASNTFHTCNGNDKCLKAEKYAADFREDNVIKRFDMRYITAIGDPKTKNEILLYNYIMYEENKDFFDKAFEENRWPFGSKLQIGTN